ncbi:hypothetical protein HDU93_004431 [Gonapodya sp. JEL0774]|nr:hypothetical protein HDU93_004431 [Gonapodya sp. JEL0774]
MPVTISSLERAHTLFLIKRFDEALEICDEAWQDPKLRGYDGFIRFYLELSYRAGKGKAMERVLSAYPNLVTLPGDVVVYLLQLKIKSKDYHQAKNLAENWLGSCSDEYLRAVIATREPETTTYEQVTELYLLHILPQLADFELAEEFLRYNDILQPVRKTVYDRSINLLKAQHEVMTKMEAAAAAAREAEQSRREASRRLEEGGREGRLSKRIQTAPPTAPGSQNEPSRDVSDSVNPANRPSTVPAVTGRDPKDNGSSVRIDGDYVVATVGGSSLRFHKQFLAAIPAILFAILGLLAAVRRYRARILDFANRVAGSMARMASVAMSPQSF